MKYSLLGASGLRVSELCLGAMTFGNREWGTDEPEAAEMYRRYRDLGGNFIDTANEMYSEGRSEEILGRLIKQERDAVVLATKYSYHLPVTNDPNAGGNHRKSLRRSVEASLRRLNTDYIDLLWVHCWDAITPVEEVMRALDDLVAAGKVLYLGISNVPAWVVARANTLAELRGWTRFAGLQLEYSLIERAIERELVPMATDLNLGIAAWSPLASGLLSGKYSGPNSNESRRLDIVPFKTVDDRSLGIASEVGKIAGKLGRTAAQVALNWLRTKDHVIPIIGARTLRQFDDNFGCLDFELSREHVSHLDSISAVEPGYPHNVLQRTRAMVQWASR